MTDETELTTVSDASKDDLPLNGDITLPATQSGSVIDKHTAIHAGDVITTIADTEDTHITNALLLMHEYDEFVVMYDLVAGEYYWTNADQFIELYLQRPETVAIYRDVAETIERSEVKVDEQEVRNASENPGADNQTIDWAAQ